MCVCVCVCECVSSRRTIQHNTVLKIAGRKYKIQVLLSPSIHVPILMTRKIHGHVVHTNCLEFVPPCGERGLRVLTGKPLVGDSAAEGGAGPALTSLAVRPSG